ncbi:MAG: hypothetical protein IJZ36_04685 [Bacilli bacterium]|nr:hypothetical protein [Bacilli bacterium]
MIKKYRQVITELNFENEMTLSYILLFIGIFVPAISGSVSTNFWYRLNIITHNQFFNFMYFMSISITILYISSNLSKNYNVITRYYDYKSLILNYIKKIVYFTIYFTSITTILVIAGALLFSFEGFAMINHSSYNIPILYYLIFKFIRNTIMTILINIIIYLLTLFFKKNIIFIISLIFNSLFVLTSEKSVDNLYNMPLLYHHYYLDTNFTSFFQEFICSILEIGILYTTLIFTYKLITKKKRDLI